MSTPVSSPNSSPNSSPIKSNPIKNMSPEERLAYMKARNKEAYGANYASALKAVQDADYQPGGIFAGMDPFAVKRKLEFNEKK